MSEEQKNSEEKSVEEQFDEVKAKSVNIEDLQKKESSKKKKKAPAKKESSSKLKTELEDTKDKYIRLSAEFDNFRKRKEQEKTDFMKYANENILKELLPVMDSFDQSLKTKEEHDTNSVLEGLDMINKQLHTLLEKFGVTPIDALDQPFDPNQHQAISKEKVDGKEPDIVVNEYQKGFKYHNKILRPSMVVVSE